MYWITGFAIYFGIGSGLLIKGSMKYGPPDGTTVFLLLVAWPFFIKEVF